MRTPKRWSILPVQAVTIAWLLYAAFLYIRRPLYWSLMDDVTNLSFVDAWRSMSWLTSIQLYCTHDRLSWGMFRPIYPLYVRFFYSLFYNRPGLGYALLAMVVIGLWWAWAGLFTRLTRLGKEAFWLFFLLACLFTPHFNLLIHASLQEKFMLASGLMQFWAIIRLRDREARLSLPQAAEAGSLLLLGAVIGLLAKSTSIFLAVPVGFWLLLDGVRRRDPARWVLLALTFIVYAAAAVFFYSIRTAYSSGYDVRGFFPRFFHPAPRMILFWGIAGLGILAAVSPSPSALLRKQFSFRPEFALWPVTLAAFLIVMTPWLAGISSYYVIPAGVFSIGCLVGFYEWLKPSLPAALRGAALLTLVAACVVSGSILERRLATQHGTESIVHWLRALPQSPVAHRVFMPTPCYEAAGALGLLSGTLVEVARNDSIPQASSAGITYVLTRRDCPARPISGFNFGTPVPMPSVGDWGVYETSSL